MNQEKQKCLRAAVRARKWAEKNWCKYLGVREDLEGMCGIASVKLFRELKREGIKSTIVEGEDHAFVLYKGYIIDITATQFGKEKIVFRKLKSKKQEEFWWQENLVFSSDVKFIQHQLESDWPTEQIYGNTKTSR